MVGLKLRQMEDYKGAIEKEAKEHAGIPITKDIDWEERYYQTFKVDMYESFIEGATSKIAERIKIEFAIKLLEEIRNEYFELGYNCYSIEVKISELENKLI